MTIFVRGEKGEKMARYIDADLLLSTLNENKIPYDSDINYFICHAPTADVRENVKGEWIDKWNMIFHCDIPTCSVCGKPSASKFNYCPHCGADMSHNCNT